MNSKKVSVIIPCYNQGHFLGEALASLERSTEKDVEIIIVNDGSTDENTNKIINELDSARYIVLNQRNQGLAMARNNGIAMAKGKYILPLDADNYIDPELISKAVDELESNAEIDIVYTDCTVFGDLQEQKTVGAFNFIKLLNENYIDALTVYRKKVWEVNKGYDAKMPFMGWEDWDFWINSHKNGFKFHYINQSLYYYRHLSTSMIHSAGLESKSKKVRLYISQKYAKYIAQEYPQQRGELLLKDAIYKMANGQKLGGVVDIFHSAFFPVFKMQVLFQRIKLGLSLL